MIWGHIKSLLRLFLPSKGNMNMIIKMLAYWQIDGEKNKYKYICVGHVILGEKSNITK